MLQDSFLLQKADYKIFVFVLSLLPVKNEPSQPTITCSKLTTEILEQGAKYVLKAWRRSGVFLLTLNIFQHCSSISIVNFEEVNTGWVKISNLSLTEEKFCLALTLIVCSYIPLQFITQKQLINSKILLNHKVTIFLS